MRNAEMIVGVDFAGPATASVQRSKIVAIAAIALGSGRYAVPADEFNGRILANSKPGWTADELAKALIHDVHARVVAFDFPFSIPQALLDSQFFAEAVNQKHSFSTWPTFNTFVGDTLPLQTPINLTPFANWRTKLNWQKRATDIVASAQPPLKDKFQVLFNMTLVGNALLAKLYQSGFYRIVPFQEDAANGEVIEVYPGITMRDLGRRDYKLNPVAAIETVLAHCAMQGIQIEVDSEIRSFCETYNTGGKDASDPDGSDALIALATAILFREGHAVEAIDAGNYDLRHQEGVIWRPAMGHLRTTEGTVARDSGEHIVTRVEAPPLEPSSLSIRQPPTQAPPLLYGPDSITEGYYELEALERGMTLEALRKHREPVALWYRGLRLYRAGVAGEWDFTAAAGDKAKLTVWGLRAQLLGLGVSSAKSALDLLLAGYYSMAFAAIRHMLESFIQYLYVGVNPSEARLWYRQPGGLAAQKDPPGCTAMVKAIEKCQIDQAFKTTARSAHRSWRLMCKGAHPSGEGLTQTTTDDDARFNLGAIYKPDLCLVGFDHGLYAASLLLLGIMGVRTLDETWKGDYKGWGDDVALWRAQQHSSSATTSA